MMGEVDDALGLFEEFSPVKKPGGGVASPFLKGSSTKQVGSIRNLG